MKTKEMSGRLESLDVLRGFDMLFIMGFSCLLIGVCKAFGCGDDFWLVEQMRHPEWIGVTQHDTIFPLFIFIAGLSFPFSMAKQLANGRTKAAVALLFPQPWGGVVLQVTYVMVCWLLLAGLDRKRIYLKV